MFSPFLASRMPFQRVALEAGLTSRNLQITISSRVSRDELLALPISKYRQSATNNVLIFWKRKKTPKSWRIFSFFFLSGSPPHLCCRNAASMSLLFDYNAGLHVPTWLLQLHVIVCFRFFLGLLMEMANACPWAQHFLWIYCFGSNYD